MSERVNLKGHAKTSFLPILISTEDSSHPNRNREITLDYLAMDFSNITQLSIQSNSTWTSGWFRLVNIDSEIFLLDQFDLISNISFSSLGSSDQLSHFLDLRTGKDNENEVLYSRGEIDLTSEVDGRSGMLSISHNFRLESLMWNILLENQYDNTSISFCISNQDQFGHDDFIIRLVGDYNVSSPSIWYVSYVQCEYSILYLSLGILILMNGW